MLPTYNLIAVNVWTAVRRLIARDVTKEEATDLAWKEMARVDIDDNEHIDTNYNLVCPEDGSIAWGFVNPLPECEYWASYTEICDSFGEDDY